MVPIRSKSTSELKTVVRRLLFDFPGVSSYSTVLKLLTEFGEIRTRDQLREWQRNGTAAPRKG